MTPSTELQLSIGDLKRLVKALESRAWHTVLWTRQAEHGRCNRLCARVQAEIRRRQSAPREREEARKE